MRFAYADPPYLGCGKFYAKRHPDALVWDHEATHADLLLRLKNDYEDGWALSLHVPSLRVMLSLCADLEIDVRVAVWVKPFASFKPGVNPAYAWEPVLFYGGRPHKRWDETVRDWHSESITLRRGLVGAKPPGFAQWILRLLNVRYDLGDTIDDLFPGTGGVTEAWRQTAIV
jgi:hypothetical protein